MSLWPLVWGLSFPKIKILSGGISDRKAPGSHQQRRCLYTVGFSNACWDLYQPCRRQSQDRIPGQDMTIKGHSFLCPLVAQWVLCVVLPGVQWHLLSAVPLQTQQFPVSMPKPAAPPPLVPWDQAATIMAIDHWQSHQSMMTLLSSLPAPTTHLLLRSISLICADFIYLVPCRHCVSRAHKFILVFWGGRPSAGMNDVILFFPSTGLVRFVYFGCSLNACWFVGWLFLQVKLFFPLYFPFFVMLSSLSVCDPEGFFLHFLSFPPHLTLRWLKVAVSIALWD